MQSPAIRAIIFAGGEMRTVPDISGVDLVVAADSGYDHALRHSVPVDVLVGDLDSISPEGLNHAQENDVEIEAHPRDKNFTDLELAIRTAIARSASAVDVYGGEGGRLGHLLGVALSTVHQGPEAVDITWHAAAGTVRAATPNHPVEFATRPGSLITLLPIGNALDVTTTGLRWPLTDATLEVGASRGISNESTADHITVEVATGAVLVILEGTDTT